MAFGWAGAASGAADSLDEILAKKLIEKQQADALALQQQRLTQDASQQQASLGLRARELARLEAGDAADEAFRGRQEARIASDRSNQRGTRTMIGDFLTQRTPGQALTDQDRGTLETMAVTDDIPLPASLTAKPSRKVITTIGPRGGPLSKSFTDEELEQGVPEYRAPTSSGSSTAGQQWVIGPDGEQHYRVPQAGDKRHDPVAERSAQPTNTGEAVDTAREVSRIAGSLRTAKGFGGVFGKYSSMTPQFAASQDTIDARTLLNSLKGLLTIENMGKMKGVLSDADMRILQQASTTLAAEMSEEAAAAELDRLVEVMGRVTAVAQPQTPEAMPSPATGRASGAGPAGGFRVVGKRPQ